jgi:hypothetical protein
MYLGVFIFFFRAGVVRRVEGANLVSLPVRTKNAMQHFVPQHAPPPFFFFFFYKCDLL